MVPPKKKVYRFKVHLLGLGVPYINADAICKYTWKKRLEIDTRTPLRYLNCEVQTWCSDLMFRLEFSLGNLQSRMEDWRLKILQGSSCCLLPTRQLVNCHDDDLLLNRSLLKTEGAVLNLLPHEKSWRMLGKELIIEFGPSLWIFEGISHVSDHGIVTFALENPFNISRAWIQKSGHWGSQASDG